MTKKDFSESLAVGFGFLLTLAIGFHPLLANLNLVPGDRGDTRLAIFILEHWFRVFKGQEAFFQLNMFYPSKLALGFSDGYFLLSLPYAAFRALGLDFFSGYQLLSVAMTAFGYAAWLLLLRKALKLQLWTSVLGAVLLTRLNALQVQVGHIQLTGFHLFPLLIYCLYRYAKTSDKRSWRAWASLLSFSAGLGLLFFTSYYPAWFFLFTVLLLAALYLMVAAVRLGAGRVYRSAALFCRSNLIQLVVALIVFAAALFPFAVIYAPLVLQDANRSFDLVLGFTPSIRDIINVSPGNYLWSPVLNLLKFKYGSVEVQMGSPPAVLVLFLLLYFLRFLPRFLGTRTNLHSREGFIFLLATTALIIIGLTVQFRGFSLWYAVHKLLPGASALRALGRYLVVFDMIVILAVVYALDEWLVSYKAGMSGSAARAGASGMIFVAALLIAEQANANSYTLDKGEELAFLAAYQQPGPDCDAFFINNAPSTDLPPGWYQIDAMMISMKLGIPTVNGYSGISPHTAFTMVPSGIEYKFNILQWLRLNNADSGICELDYRAHGFQPVNVAADDEKYRQLVHASYLDGFSALFKAATGFRRDQIELSNFYPEYLEAHGYLDPSLGHGTGTAYKWIRDRYWLGVRPCGKNTCIGIGIVGAYSEIQAIIEEYGSRSAQIFFPYPERWQVGTPIAPETNGQLLLVFPLVAFQP